MLKLYYKRTLYFYYYFQYQLMYKKLNDLHNENNFYHY